jgi:hypothetical protein
MDMKLDLTMAGAIAARTVGVKYGFVGYPAYKYYLIDFNVAGRFNPFTLAFRAIRKLLSYFNRSFDFSRVSRPFEDFFGNLLTPTLKPLLYAVVVKWVQDLNAEVTIKRVTQVREPNESPKVDPRKVVYYRGPECVNWMLAYPWVLEEGQSISEHLEYYFTDTRKRFEMVAIELYSAKGDKYMGYLVYMLTQIGEKLQLRLLDYHFETQIDERYILAVALEQAHKENVDHIEIRSQHVHGLQSSLLGKLLLVQRERYCHYKPYAEDSPLGRNGHLMELDYCDGDMPFA